MEREKVTFDIPYIRLKFRAEILEDTELTSAKISALRGEMGEALLVQNCASDRKCDNCMFMQACPVNHTLYTYMAKKPAYVTGKESIGYLNRYRKVQLQILYQRDAEFRWRKNHRWK